MAAGVSIYTPNAYNYLLGVALFAAIVVWMMILISHLSFRRPSRSGDVAGAHAAVSWMQYFGLLMLAAILITMGLHPDYRVSWEVGVPWMVLISAAYFVWARSNRHAD